MLISVVIPLYNKAHTIGRTLGTVMRQTFQDFEVVIVNDGSTDDGANVIRKNFTDSRIRIIDQENAGVSMARNRGVDEAKGKWIAFLDGDDEWHPEYLNEMQKLIVKYPEAGLFLCAGLYGNLRNNKISYRIGGGYERYKGKINLFHNPDAFIHTSATIVNKDKFNKTNRFYSGMIRFEDLLAFESLALRTEVVYLGIPLSKYVGGVEGQLTVMNQTNPKALESGALYYNQLVTDCISLHGYILPELKIFFKYRLRHQFKGLLNNGDYLTLCKEWGMLSKAVRSLLHRWEYPLMSHYPKLALLWINFSKIIWRTHGYPIVGQKINESKIKSEYLKW